MSSKTRGLTATVCGFPTRPIAGREMASCFRRFIRAFRWRRPEDFYDRLMLRAEYRREAQGLRRTDAELQADPGGISRGPLQRPSQRIQSGDDVPAHPERVRRDGTGRRHDRRYGRWGGGSAVAD